MGQPFVLPSLVYNSSMIDGSIPPVSVTFAVHTRENSKIILTLGEDNDDEVSRVARENGRATLLRLGSRGKSAGYL